MKKLTHSLVVSILLGFSGTFTSTAAESLSVLLQKGIFAEETEGDLDAAIKIYDSIVKEAEANRSLVAQAKYRLGVCYKKKGSKAEAIEILNQFVEQYPSDGPLHQKAQNLLADLGQSLPKDIAIRKLQMPGGSVHAVSDDGRYLSYMERQSPNVLIYNTSTQRTHTVFEGSNENSAWDGVIFSPDTHLIAYVLSKSIYVANIDGSNARRIYDGEGDDSMVWLVDWSPNGKELILGGWDRNDFKINSLEVTTGVMKEIKQMKSNLELENLRCSRDGQFLSYHANLKDEQKGIICIIDLDSGEETQMVEGDITGLIGWAPGDSQIVFSSQRTGVNSIWAIGVKGGKPSGKAELIKANLGDVFVLDITREGKIFYCENKSSFDLHLAEVDFATGEILKQPRYLTDKFPGMNIRPAWSNDGSKISFAVRPPHKQFVIMSEMTEVLQRIPTSHLFSSVIQNYSWSKDESFMLVQSRRSAGAHGVHRLNLVSKEVETLISQEPNFWRCRPQLTSDDKSFYYVNRRFFKDDEGAQDWNDEIILRNIQSGKEEIVYNSPEKLQIYCPYQLSPDGRLMALVTSTQFRTDEFATVIKILQLHGNETRELLRLAPRENVNSITWTPDGKRLVYNLQRESSDGGMSGSRELWVVAVDSGENLQIKLPHQRVMHPSIHPDGRKIVFQAGDWEGHEVWVMEGMMDKSLALNK